MLRRTAGGHRTCGVAVPGTVLAHSACAPAEFRAFPARERWLSPMDGPALAENTAAAAAYCLRHPEWRLNIQAHKAWGIR